MQVQQSKDPEGLRAFYYLVQVRPRSSATFDAPPVCGRHTKDMLHTKDTLHMYLTAEPCACKRACLPHVLWDSVRNCGSCAYRVRG